MKKPKVIVIGLDGATWDLIKPLADNGDLPTFKKLMKNGAWGKLKSTIPPVTFPAWQSLFTGMNPGKLGVYNFVQIDIKNRRFKINTPNSFKGNPIWKILSECGYKSCVINVPTARVEKINGVIVGGAFSNNDVYPSKYKSILDEIEYEAYPEELTTFFLQSGVEPPIDVVKRTISSRFELAKIIIEKEKPDFLALVIFEIDNLQHFYWGEDIVYQAWKHIDGEIGSFISEYLDDCYIFLVSDHGFTKANKTIFISKFLENIGLIKYNKSIKYKIFSKINVERIIKIAKQLKISKIFKILPREKALSLISFFQDESGRLSAKALEAVIDWENSVAIPIDNLIYLNCSEGQKRHLKIYIKNELEKLDEVDKVLYKDEIYDGEYIESAPDLVILPKRGVDILENPFVDKVVINHLARPRWRAIHDMYGIFLAIGPNIRAVKEIEVDIYDITPTILSIFGIPPDPDMDGRILYEIFSSKPHIKKGHLEKLRLKRKIKELSGKL